LSQHSRHFRASSGHPLAHTERDIVYLLTRWLELPQHIRQTIITLVRLVEWQSDGADTVNRE